MPQRSIGGEINAVKSIRIRQCGSDKDVVTKLSIYDKNKSLISDKIKELYGLNERLTSELDTIERQLKTKATLMKRSGGEDVSNRHRDEVKKWVDAYNDLKKKISYVEEKMKELKTTLSNPGERNGFIQVLDRCYAGTTISIYDNALPITATLVNKRFSCKEQSVSIEGT